MGVRIVTGIVVILFSIAVASLLANKLDQNNTDTYNSGPDAQFTPSSEV